jgi:hypothetical protein
VTAAEPSPRRDKGSLARLLVGIALCLLAVVGAVFGFLQLTTLLDQGGYGTPAVRNTLIVLGAAGASLAAGVATVIWDLSKRFEG